MIKEMDMLNIKNKKLLSIIFICTAVLFLIARFAIPTSYFKANTPSLFLTLSIIFFVAGIVFLVLFLVDKMKSKTKTQQTHKEYIPDTYDKFVDWWSKCDEEEIKKHTILLGAYRVMWLYDEVANGGYSQFFDNKEDWDMEETAKLFKMLLPDDLYSHFVSAWKSYESGKGTESFNKTFNYEKMEQVINELADRVVAILVYKVKISEDYLIDKLKPYFKQKGYKKVNKRWTKDTGEFILTFFIQGSQYDKDFYYIRPGVSINSVECGPLDYYGHFNIDIEHKDSVEEIINEYEKFVQEWTNKPLIKQRLLEFIEWDKRNPLEKRQEGLVDYKKDPCPCNQFFKVSELVKKYIMDKF